VPSSWDSTRSSDGSSEKDQGRPMRGPLHTIHRANERPSADPRRHPAAQPARPRPGQARTAIAIHRPGLDRSPMVENHQPRQANPPVPARVLSLSDRQDPWSRETRPDRKNEPLEARTAPMTGPSRRSRPGSPIYRRKSQRSMIKLKKINTIGGSATQNPG
jgi:hypothetical protein